ncbi:pentatricopeptide repeat-containing protein At5g03800 isoform X2 [Malania oleifera]|uniref:pentatricopeptide repeat-containing protein At5g03800 isoform X2 n=1 Tax=Malania oleifera TaxID=397392 RepID=UPI0025AE3C35|nr:pentatricopeptide repeat-containing protein At5g03800 isoform X2 [Malania oleifera]
MDSVIHPAPPSLPRSSLSPFPCNSLHSSPVLHCKPSPPSPLSSASFPKTPPRLSRPKPRYPSLSASPAELLPNPPPPLSPSHSESAEFLVDDYYNLLHLSVRYNDVELVEAVHASILKLEDDTRLGTALMVAYLKLGMVADAYEVFVGLSSPDVVSYTAMVSGFAKSGREAEAVDLFYEMRSSGIEPNEYSFVAILTACIRVAELQLGFQVHAMVLKMGYLNCTFVSNALMGLYCTCGCLDFVLDLFDEMHKRDIASWNTVISSVVKELMYQRAFELFRNMQRSDRLKVDRFTLSILLAASAGTFALTEGQEIHAHALRMGFESDLSVNNALIGFYAKCGSIKDVIALFERMAMKDVITWTEMITAYMDFGMVDFAMQIFDKMPERNCVSYNALLSGFCHNGEESRALNLFLRMVEEGVELTDFTLTSVVKACGLLMEVRISQQIHGFIVKFGFGLNDCIEAALVDMYTRCASMVDAHKLFDHWPSQWDSSIIWASMICGYARNGQPEEAISLFCQKLFEETVVLDEVASTATLGVCGTLGFQEMGEQIHCHAVKSGFLSDSGIGNAILSMYSKCGNMDSAIKVFNFMPSHDIVSWNGLIAGHLLHRWGDEALAVWSKMEEANIRPDTVTFVLIISAYKHTNANLVDDCRKLFRSMKTMYDIEPTSEHYASLVDVLGYWGLFEEAEEVINMMPFEPEVSVWRALLDTCRIHLNTALGKWAAKCILAMEPQDPSTYILVSNLYSASGRWHCSERVREEMREKGLRKHPARSWIIHQNWVHSFYSRDKSHSQWIDIYRGLEILILECLKAGYVPDTSFVLHEVEEHQKKDFLFYHSAKLAVTYGLLMTKRGQPIRVVKNIHLCGDCHTFLKYVSAVTRREISLRDASGFHCFVSGQCSCNDRRP